MTGYAVLQSRALNGMQAAPVHVEVHIANGLPSFTLVGLADTEVKEARERVRSALLNRALSFLPTSASRSISHLLICPKTRGALTCPSRCASWPLVGRWMRKN